MKKTVKSLTSSRRVFAASVAYPQRSALPASVLARSRSYSSVSAPGPSSSSSSGSPSVQAAPSSAGSSSTSSSATSSASASTSPPPPSSSSTASSSSPSSSAVAKKRNTDLALILTGTLGLSALLFYNLRPQNSAPGSVSNLSTLSPSSKTFTLPVNTSSGLELRTISMLSQSSINTILRNNEKSYAIARPNNPLYRYDTNSVASNETCEDAQAFTIFQDNNGNDFILASVFDGHSGYHTSRLMADVLEKYIARELMGVIDGSYKSLSVTGESWWNWLKWSMLGKPMMPSPPSSGASTDATSVDVRINQRTLMIPEALRNAYKIADRDIVQPPLEYLKQLEEIYASATGPTQSPNAPNSASTSTALPTLPITPEQRRVGLSLLNPALSGSCALSALIDTTSSPQQLYVAVAGDSRAVMGSWNPETKKWKIDVLSEDQTGRNEAEVKRMRSEHPKNESETVIMRGRVLGGLEPTRSFGDCKYKWPLGIQERLIQVFKPSTSRTAPPSLYKTPPYVTADPVVTTRAISTPPAAEGINGQQANGSNGAAASTAQCPVVNLPANPISSTLNPRIESNFERRFIVLATDGLYDCLSSEEVVGLVAAHLDGVKDAKSQKQLFERLEASDGTGKAVSPHKPRQSGGGKDDSNRYVFEDDNLGTHLIRNALGGAQREHVAALLSIPAPYSRRYRDDITVTVLLLGNDPAGPHPSIADREEKAMSGVKRIYTSPAKAKL